MKIWKKILALITFLKNVNYKNLFKELMFFSKFFLLVIVYLIHHFIVSVGRKLQKLPFLAKLLKPIKEIIKNIYAKVLKVLNTQTEGEISSLDLITLSTGHLKAKKNRTMITIGGMAIGFGSVIFLLSLGYGVQDLVVSRVARLDEMRQADITVGQATSLSLDDEAIKSFSELSNVESVLPMVSIVSKVTYNNSVSDVVAYGVTKSYLEQSAIQPSKGNIFEDSELSQTSSSLDYQGSVAGAKIERISGAKMNKQLSEINYSIHPLVWKAVKAEPSLNSQVIGYTRRNVGDQQAVEVWGNSYNSILDLPEGVDFFDNNYSPWIKDDFPIWKKEKCEKTNYDCVDGEYILLKDGALQQIKSGFITEDDTTLSRFKIIEDSAPLLAEGEVFEQVEFSFKNNAKFPVYSNPTNSSKMLLLYSAQKTSDTLYSGELVFGDGYNDDLGWGLAGVNKNNKKIGYWVRAKLPLWRELDCQDCNNLFIKEVDDYGNQIEAYAFVPANVVEIESMLEPITFGQVLGDATESAETSSESGLLSTTSISNSNGIFEPDVTEIVGLDGSLITAVQQDDGSVDWVNVASGSATGSESKITEVSFAENSQKVAVVNQAMLNMLGIPRDEAVGKSFETSLMLDAEFFKNKDYQAKSTPTQLKIIGVIPEEKTPAFYLSFNDVKNLGVENYTQLKVIVKDKNDLKKVRQEIESFGYRTSSVVDTVSRINDLFGTIRLGLSILGLIALSVAALGMFNTLTVSLLEKTREVGLMKAIGMKSNEVKRLFLSESIIIGLLGGILGLISGTVAGYILSFVLSTVSVLKGLGFINLVSIPVVLGAGIITLSFVVGVVTGLYPAHRATKISALNALRYE
ncbi:ABC transporter permease [Candidatus Woesebacteria bacterium]|nr:ABC transporter permease [Candidatus Woesebacteria bacterium]